MRPARRPSIWHIVPKDGVGGVEVAAKSMAKRDDLPCDFQLHLIAGSPVVCGPRIIGSRFASLLDPSAHFDCLKRILAHRPDVVIFSLWWSVPCALLLRLLRPRQRIVYFLHLERDTHLLDAMLTRLGLLVADEVWGDSEATLQRRRLRLARPTRRISFVTERLPQANRQDRALPRFVVWTRLHRQKGLDRAIAFVALLAENGVDARFDIWGRDDGALQELERLTAELRIRDRVIFRGPLPRQRLAEVAAEASFFLQPSRSEGMAMSCVEAMQFGLIPVVTAVGEMKEYVKDGKTGIILDVADMRTGVSAIGRLIGDPQAYRILRQNARDHWRAAPLYADDVSAAGLALAAAVPAS